MKNIEEEILKRLSSAGRPITIRTLMRDLGVRGAARRDLDTTLKRLMASGEIVRVRRQSVGLPTRMNLVTGVLRCNPAGFGFVVSDVGAAGSEARAAIRRGVYVSAANMKDALHGDRVLARLERATSRGPEGCIIRVLERRLERLVGRFEEEGRRGANIVPFDRRILRNLYVPAGETGGAASGDMVLAEMTRPPTASRDPRGRVVRLLGRSDEPGIDLKVILAKYDLNADFTSETEAEALRLAREPGPAEIAGRVDFRGWTAVTIDPEDARDHDDAIAIERHARGFRLAVHIADVAHYVQQGSRIDNEAYWRGTSVYFPGFVVPMLPHALSSEVCSLREGRDRLTQSVILDVDLEGRVRRAEFHDGVIRSAARLGYSEVQGILNGDEDLRRARAPLTAMLESMAELARIIRARRHARGALDFDVPEPRLMLDEKGEMTGVLGAERLESMRIVEEFMLAANEAVARHLVDAGMPTLFRIHEPPDQERVEEFCELAASLGHRIPYRDGGARPEDFQRILRQIAGRPEEKLVSYLLLRTMKLARYHEENLGHFGLATERYLHFTSPIRRYPDLVAHRVLRALRRRRDARPDERLQEALPEMSRHLSERERLADEAERELVEWKKVRYMARKLGEVFEGYVVNVQAFGMFVELTEVFVQGLVHVSSMRDDYYAFDERGHALRGESTRRVYRLGDRVQVQVAGVDLDRRQISFALLEVIERSHAQPSRSLRSARPTKPIRARAKRVRRSR